MNGSSHSAADAVVLTDRREAATAALLITDFGAQAGKEAARRARDFRDKGNVVRFCRWRRIGRLVDLMAGTAAGSTCH